MAKKTGSIILFILILAPLLFTACGRYYTCDVGGYVKDSESGAGINGVRIRFYVSEPDSADEANPRVETTTMSSGGNAGYYNHKFLWQNMFGSFGDEGDIGEIWISAVHEDYTSTVVQRIGLMSDTTNVLADITMVRASFEATEVRGRVLNVSSEGVNNVRVVLDLASTTDDAVDYVATTRTDGGLDGVFIFSNVRWRDDNPDSASTDTETAGIYIDDNDYNSTYTVDNMFSITLTSDDNTELPSTIQVTREPRTEFSANIRGRCIYRLGTAPDIQEFGVSGVEVKLVFSDDPAKIYYDITDTNGVYNFSIEWIDLTADTIENGVTIPEGEDVQLVNITIEDLTDAGNIYTSTDYTNRAIKSWINPNTIPDSADTNPGA